MPFQWYIICLLLISRWLRYSANNIQSCVKAALIPYILFYFFLFYFPRLHFQHLSMIFYSIYDILYTIGKFWFPSFQWDCCSVDMITYLAPRHFLLSLLSIQISHPFPMQLISFKIVWYSRQYKLYNGTCYFAWHVYPAKS